jgi:hypothetical protein
LDSFINFLPDLQEDEVYYLCLFGRHKYCPSFPNTRDSGQLVRSIARKKELKEKIQRFETPIGSYSRDGVIAPQEAVCCYIGLNPRSLPRANKNLLIEFARRIADGDLNFNPISAATAEIHRATCRKFFVDFDYDGVEPCDYYDRIEAIIPKNGFKIIKTRGGFHLVVELEKVKEIKTNWYKMLSALPNCDVKGSNSLTPIPGCVQGGDFYPYFVDY